MKATAVFLCVQTQRHALDRIGHCGPWVGWILNPFSASSDLPRRSVEVFYSLGGAKSPHCTRFMSEGFRNGINGLTELFCHKPLKYPDSLDTFTVWMQNLQLSTTVNSEWKLADRLYAQNRLRHILGWVDGQRTALKITLKTSALDQVLTVVAPRWT